MNLTYSENSCADAILNKHRHNQNIMAVDNSECYERLPKLKRLSQRPPNTRKKITFSNCGHLRHQVQALVVPESEPLVENVITSFQRISLGSHCTGLPNMHDIDEDELPKKNFKTRSNCSSLNGSSECNELSGRSGMTSTSGKSTLEGSHGSTSFRGIQMNLPKAGSNVNSSQSVSCSKRRVSVPDGRMTEISQHVKKQKTKRRSLPPVRLSTTSILSSSSRSSYKASLVSSLEKLSSETKERILREMRNLVKAIAVLGIWHNSIRQQYENSLCFAEQFRIADKRSVVQYTDEQNANDLGINMFDASIYKANHQTKLSKEARRILLTEPELRTEEEINYAMIAIRNHKAITDYPVKIQRNLARYGWLLPLEPRRLVVKEGHQPLAFYFIFYGTVMVAVYNDSRHEAITRCYLNRGDSFGTYEKLFMSGGTKNINDPDHNEFMNSLDFLKEWPVQILREINNDRNKLIFTYFKRGVVMVNDTRLSKWIYIVKSGSVDVLKKLERRKATINPRTGRSLPCSRLGSPDNRRPVVFPVTAREPEKWKDEICSDIARGNWSLNFPRNSKPFSRSKTVIGCYSSNWCPPDKVKVQVTEVGKDNELTAEPLESDQDEPRKTPNQRRTLVDEMEGSFKKRDNSASVGENKNPIFVRIQTLTKGESFGVTNIVFAEQPSFSLVSNGAECIMISKELYEQHCSMKQMNNLRSKYIPFPNEDSLKENLMTRINWNAYKRAVLHQTMQNIRDNKSKYTLNV